MNIWQILSIGFGGFLGSICRYIAVKTVDEKIQSFFPFGTFTVNVMGSFLLGIIYSIALRKAGLNENWKLFLGVGFCGGFTTFSAFAWENYNLIQQKLPTAMFYIITSIITAILALGTGVWLGKNISS